jgi:mono/diheme cytochrome c family protein
VTRVTQGYDVRHEARLENAVVSIRKRISIVMQERVQEKERMRSLKTRAFSVWQSFVKGGMTMRYLILLASLFLVLFVAGVKGGLAVDTTPPSNAVPSGKAMYQLYCAECHGAEAKGDGPYAPMLKVPPPNLTTLARRNYGKFPYDYVSNILRFGPGPTILHGSAEMPTWGPIFEYHDKNDERVVQQRIKNLSNYLASLQEK